MVPPAPTELGDFTATRRVLLLAAIALLLGIVSTFLSVALLRLIALFTNLFFFQRLSFDSVSPAIGTSTTQTPRA